MKAAATVLALCGLAACDTLTSTEEWANTDLDKIIDSIPDCYISCEKANYDKYCKGTKFEGLDYFCYGATPYPTGKKADDEEYLCKNNACDIATLASDITPTLTTCRRLDNKDKPISASELQAANTKLAERFAKAPLPENASPTASKTSSGNKPTETTKASEDKKNAAADSGAKLSAAVAVAAGVAAAAF